MTAGIEERPLSGPEESSGPKIGVVRRALSGFSRFATLHVFTSLTRRIVVLNLAALIVLVSGILLLNQFRAGLIDARVSSLLIQGEIIAGAIAASATADTDTISVDPDKLLELQTGQSISPNDQPFESTEFSINPEKVAPVLRRLISPTGTRARIYDRDGTLVVDSQHLDAGNQILAFPLSPPEGDSTSWFETVWQRLNPVAVEPRLAALSGARRRQRARLHRSRVGAQRAGDAHRSHQRQGRADRLGRGAYPALPLRPRRAAVVDAGRRHRRYRPRRTSRHRARLHRRRRRHDPAVDPARRHDCLAAPPPSPTPPTAFAAASAHARRFRISRSAATRSGTSARLSAR